jgi:hypothetical protein
MDRLTRSLLAHCGLGLVVLFTGCRTPRSEVPPGRQYTNDGRQVPPVGFSASPHEALNNGMPSGGTVPGGIPGRPDAMYGPQGAGASNNLGMTQGAAFGPPATGVNLPGTEAPGAQGASGFPASGGGGSSLPPYSSSGSTLDPSAASAGYGAYSSGGSAAGAGAAGGSSAAGSALPR